jgi:hypothetical protein
MCQPSLFELDKPNEVSAQAIPQEIVRPFSLPGMWEKKKK